MMPLSLVVWDAKGERMRKLALGGLILPVVLATAALVPVYLASASGGCRVIARAPTLSADQLHVVGHARESSGCIGRHRHFRFKLRRKVHRSGDTSRLKCTVHVSGRVIRCRDGACNSSFRYRSVIRAYNETQLLDSDRSKWTWVCRPGH